MLNKNTLKFLGTAAAAATGMLTAKFLESKETRAKLVENMKDIAGEIGAAIEKGIDATFDKAEEGVEEIKRLLS